MITIFRNGYVLLLSYNPCDIFVYFNVKEMHGLNIEECKEHENSTSNTYIAGWNNFVPKESGGYVNTDPRYVFINLSRCTDDVHTVGLIMHELMHQSFHMHADEEEIITWAEKEAYEVFTIVKTYSDEL